MNRTTGSLDETTRPPSADIKVDFRLNLLQSFIDFV
jgi:hypothetical protein